MTVPQCSECAHMKRDPKTQHMRCHSPQIAAARRLGVITVFERDSFVEHRHDDATRKCGPQALNFVKREYLA